MLVSLIRFLWRLFEFWLMTVGVVAFLSGPLECLELTSDVVRKVAKHSILAPKYYYYQAYNYTLGYEL